MILEFSGQGVEEHFIAGIIQYYWASEASPTLGCSIEISRDIYIPYFLDYSAPLFSSRPRIDRALCPGLRVILRALE